jgi:dienelactone hydrolase
VIARPAVLALALAVLAGCAATTPGASTVSTDTDAPLPTITRRPDGAGPFPAVVVMHDCSGLGPRSSGAPARWATELVGRGYVVAMPDSFTPRGVPDGVCTAAPPRGADVTPERRARDAFATLAHLRTLAYVDGRRVGLMGGSHGGTTTLTAMRARAGEPSSDADRAGFAAAVALYPRCGNWLRGRPAEAYRSTAPLLILIGEADDWTPAANCRQLAQAAGAAPLLSLIVYPGAHHSFDSPNPTRYVAARINPSSSTGRGATTGGQPEAWSAAIRDATTFLARHLR